MLGIHIIVELHGLERELLDDAERLEEILTEATTKSGATIVGSVFHTFSPHGVTGVIGIKESHLSIHTWPEFGYAALDVFTCRAIDPKQIVDCIVEKLKPKHYTSIVISRGEPYTESLESRQLPQFPELKVIGS
ncbi:MAG TPA: adenosylmethionine decarboxylase [Proteobacteria bacterium]|nr:adenosylmethionine decarboxylase [Pseudomonadota bacterium]